MVPMACNSFRVTLTVLVIGDVLQERYLKARAAHASLSGTTALPRRFEGDEIPCRSWN